MGRRTGKTNLLLAVVIIGIVAVSAFSINAIAQMDWSKTGAETGTVYSGEITAYKDGQPVSEPILMGAFSRAGTPIDSLVVNINWISTGDSVDWSTFELVGTLQVERLLWNPEDEQFSSRYVSSYSTTFSSAEQTGDWTKTLILGSDICTLATIIAGGWDLRFTVILTGTVQDTIGQTLSDTIDFMGTVGIGYTSDYGLTGYAEW